jgi:hypothetical protein
MAFQVQAVRKVSEAAEAKGLNSKLQTLNPKP